MQSDLEKTVGLRVCVCHELFFYSSQGLARFAVEFPFTQFRVRFPWLIWHLSHRAPWLGEPCLWSRYSKWQSPLGGDGWTQRVLPGGGAQAGGRQMDVEKRRLSVLRAHLLFSGRVSWLGGPEGSILQDGQVVGNSGQNSDPKSYGHWVLSGRGRCAA